MHLVAELRVNKNFTLIIVSQRNKLSFLPFRNEIKLTMNFLVSQRNKSNYDFSSFLTSYKILIYYVLLSFSLSKVR